jgi:tetraacyldisaccharide 4'-kinase
MSPLPLAPLEWMYGSIVRYRNARFDRIPAQRLRRPVISVGNLSVGGSGKTPLVSRVAMDVRAQKRNGWMCRDPQNSLVTNRC